MYKSHWNLVSKSTKTIIGNVGALRFSSSDCNRLTNTHKTPKRHVTSFLFYTTMQNTQAGKKGDSINLPVLSLIIAIIDLSKSNYNPLI